jgi:dTDP-4-dehydrorhamnose 3,5-epimerase
MIKTEILPGTFHIQLSEFSDIRGVLIKISLNDFLEDIGIENNFNDEFYTVSKKDVIRGMHFQLPPFDHYKIAYCPSGIVLDVLLDLRTGINYGQHKSLILDSKKPSMIFIPSGVAHGFKALTDNAIIIYKTSSLYSRQHESGIKFNSFGFNWDCSFPTLSERDANLATLNNFITPF